MSWQVLAAISVISISVAALFQKLAMKGDDSDPISSAIIFQGLLTIFSFLYALTQGFHLPNISLFPYFVGSAALYAIGTVSFFHAVKKNDASEVTVISGSGVLVTVLFSFLFLGDRLQPLQLLGVFLILLSVFVLNFSRLSFHLNEGAWYAILGTSCYGLAVVFDSYIIKQFDAVSFLPIACLFPGTLIWLRYIRRTKKLLNEIRTINRNLLVYSVLYAVQAITFYMALERGALVSQMSSVSRAAIILTVILATVFLRERNYMAKKFISAILTTIGVLLVT